LHSKLLIDGGNHFFFQGMYTKDFHGLIR